MSARWAAQGTPPGSQGRVVQSNNSMNPEVQAIVRLVKADADFRNELKNVILRNGVILESVAPV